MLSSLSLSPRVHSSKGVYTWDDEESKRKGVASYVQPFLRTLRRQRVCGTRAPLFRGSAGFQRPDRKKKCPIKINPKAVPSRTIPPRSLLPRNSYCYLYTPQFLFLSLHPLSFPSFASYHFHAALVGMHCFPVQCISERCGSVSG